LIYVHSLHNITSLFSLEILHHGGVRTNNRGFQEIVSASEGKNYDQGQL
jgi:hypothetical protein